MVTKIQAIRFHVECFRYEESKEQSARVLRHMLRKVELALEIITFFDIIQRTVEMARIYGVDFDAVVKCCYNSEISNC